MFVMMLFWWGSFAATQSNIEFSSKAACEAAVVVVNKKINEQVDGNLYAVCVKK